MPHEDQIRLKRLSYLLIFFGLAVVLTLWMYFAFIVMSLRERAWSDAESRSGNLLRSVERIIDRDIKLYDLGMQAVVDGMQNPVLESVSPEVRQLALFDRASQAPGYGAIFVLDEHGNAFIDSRSLMSRRLNGADRDYFTAHTARDVGLFIGPPRNTRISGRDMIPLSRRFTYADGTFAGVIVGAIELSYFEDLFKTINHDPGLDIELFFDGPNASTIRVPFGRRSSDDAVSEVTTRLIAQASEGRFVAPDQAGGERLNTFKRVSAYPMRANISIPTEIITDAWMPQAQSILVVVGALTAATLLLLLILRRELMRRLQAETALSQLALTDPLTGISNRRHFDDTLRAVWTDDVCRAVALILIDVDFFKRYNDRYGHPAGDQVLKTVSAIITGVARDHDGLAFRIGGEEFAVIAVNRDERAAVDLAEETRSAIEAAAVAHVDGVGGVVTASVGLVHSARYPLATGSQWLSLADEALYRAKRAGRNRSSVSGLCAPVVQSDDQRPIDRTLAKQVSV